MAKTLAELELELTALDHLHKQSDVVLTTVTHHHLYGIVFRLLRPFCYQQAFSKYLQDYPEDLISMAKKYGRFTLVSSPAHLSRMNTEQDWHEVKADCQQVFSSAAPLQRHDSMTVSSCLEAEVTEIYGSTETGAIAWRCQQQSEQDALWRALSHIQLSLSSRAYIADQHDGAERSPWIWLIGFSSVTHGRFSLLGRVDQIVKVEGKRLSLTQLEQQLLTLELL